MTRLLDQRAGGGSAGWLLVALLLGMVHAIQPGHGKTLVAAATLDGTSGLGRGVGLGLMTAGCHLISVVAIAAILWSFPSSRTGTIHLAVARGAGFVVAAVGCFRVGRHLAGRDGDHQHRATTLPGVWSLGLAAGFVPCWDAVALVVLANSIGQLAWGLTLLMAFSLGLAVVLVGVGTVAGRVQRRLVNNQRSGPLGRWLGLASGLVLAAIGLSLLAN